MQPTGLRGVMPQNADGASHVETAADRISVEHLKLGGEKQSRQSGCAKGVAQHRQTLVGRRSFRSVLWVLFP